MQITPFINLAIRLKEDASIRPRLEESRAGGRFKLLDSELQVYLCAINSARLVGSLGKEDLNIFLDSHFAIVEPSISSLSSSSIAYISTTLDAVDFFAAFCPLIWVQAHGSTQDLNPGNLGLPSMPLPLSMWRDEFRLRRALLRFQLFCELFHQPGDSSDSVSDWEERIPEQELFWLRYEWWEVEEVKCIYQVIVSCLESFDVAPGQVTSTTNLLPQGCFLQERGLPQLRHFLDESSARRTAFGDSYVRRVLERAFHGFRKADPDDFGWFSRPQHVVKSHCSPAYTEPPVIYRSKNRRWAASPYPGVQLELLTCPSHAGSLPYECQLLATTDLQTVTKFMRMIGWAFWGKADLLDWMRLKSFRKFQSGGHLD